MTSEETSDSGRDLRKMVAALPHPIIMDVGSGAAPLPIAHILVDRFPWDAEGHRNTGKCTGYPGQLFVKANVEDLPFDDESVDFIWCSHLLEHVDDPVKAMGEMRRVSKQGALLIPPVEMESIIQMAEQGTKANGHNWLCRSIPQSHLEFMRCDDSDKDEVRGLLRKLGVWPRVPYRLFETAIFQGWGWNGWPSEIEARIVEPTDENLYQWNQRFVAKETECPS